MHKETRLCFGRWLKRIKKHQQQQQKNQREMRCEWSVDWHFNIQPQRKINISCSNNQKNNEHSGVWPSTYDDDAGAVAIHIHLSFSFISIYFSLSPVPTHFQTKFHFPNVHTLGLCVIMMASNGVLFETVKNKNENLFDLVSEKLL